MRTGLKAVAIPFGYSIAWLVGKLERIQGDEYLLTGYRILSLDSRTHEDVIADGTESLSRKAAHELHRLQILDSRIPGAWAAKLDVTPVPEYSKPADE